MHIQFLGATQTVTGAKYLIEAEKIKLLVDCGLFQGQKELRLRNWNSLPIDAAAIQYILLTHAHIDHSGYIPLLVKNGFRGKVICTEATRDFCEILLPDSGHLQEEEANYHNRHGLSKHKPALPLYTREEAEKSLAYFHPIDFNKNYKITDDLGFSFHYASHILGASLIRVSHYNSSILFSGDLGRPDDPILYPPVAPPYANYLVVESTYGNRLHVKVDPTQQLAEVINRTMKRGGVVLIPAFAVGRAQTILYYIHCLKEKKQIADIPVFVDSPMATDAARLFCHSDQHRLSESETEQVCKVAHYIQSVEESKELNNQKMPMIIIAASGMLTGGRILHHVKYYAPDYKNSIVFTGFQAAGTRGDKIVRGEKEVKIFEQMVTINAEVVQLDNTSSHADYHDILNWLNNWKQHQPRKIFITHGEKAAAFSLQEKIEQQFGWSCLVPEYLYKQELI